MLRVTSQLFSTQQKDSPKIKDQDIASGKEAIMCVREVVYYRVCETKEQKDEIWYCNPSSINKPCPDEFFKEHWSTKAFCYACYLVHWDKIMDESAHCDVALVQSAIKSGVEPDVINRIKEKQEEEMDATFIQLDPSYLRWAVGHHGARRMRGRSIMR